MTVKSALTNSCRGTKADRHRRDVVKLIAAGGVGVIAFPWVFRTANSYILDCSFL